MSEAINAPGAVSPAGPVNLVSALLQDQSPPRVLVVDDDKMTQMLLRRNLTQAGYVVDVACDGPEALAKLRADRSYDLIILDFLMPAMDGYEVINQITADEGIRNIPVVVVSGVDDRANAALLVEAGAADYLTKPIDGGLLRARAARCIETKRARERERHLLDEVRSANAKLHELEELRDRLTHMIVHDLRTPLTSLLGSLRLLTSGAAPEAARASMIQLALETGASLSDMINELLDIHRLESGADFIRTEPVEIEEVARGAIAKVQGFADGRGLEVVLETSPATIEVDRAKTERVLVNLLGNAIKVSPRGRPVCLRTFVEEDAVRFEVQDEGPGIPEADHERIFERFYRVERPGAAAVASTGLGLAFCKLAVEGHGGRIAVESRVGEGSRFIVRLPR